MHVGELSVATVDELSLFLSLSHAQIINTIFLKVTFFMLIFFNISMKMEAFT